MALGGGGGVVHGRSSGSPETPPPPQKKTVFVDTLTCMNSITTVTTPRWKLPEEGMNYAPDCFGLVCTECAIFPRCNNTHQDPSRCTSPDDTPWPKSKEQMLVHELKCGPDNANDSVSKITWTPILMDS